MAVRKPKPGVYYGVPYLEYERWPYVRNSELGPALRSGEHYRASLEVERVETDAFRLGSAIHEWLWRHGEFVKRYVTMPDFADDLRDKYKMPRASKEYKERVDAWYRENAGRKVLSVGEMETVRQCGAALDRAGLGAGLNAAKEVSFVGDCQDTGLRLKCRVDVLEADRIVDIKSTRDASRFGWDAVKYGYHRQAAFYQEVVAQVLGEVLPVWWYAVETEPPYCVRCAPVSDELIDAGWHDVHTALHRIADVKAGRCAGYWNPAAWTLRGDACVLRVNGDTVAVE